MCYCNPKSLGYSRSSESQHCSKRQLFYKFKEVFYFLPRDLTGVGEVLLLKGGDPIDISKRWQKQVNITNNFLSQKRMNEQIYPKIHADGQALGPGPAVQSDKINFMLDKQKTLREKLTHYKKIKRRWGHGNTGLKITGYTLTAILSGLAILAGAFWISFSRYLRRLINIKWWWVLLHQSKVTLLNVKNIINKSMIISKSYLDKMEVLFIKCKKDGQIFPQEFELFHRLLKEYENGSKHK